jgi:dinuclear metal center YbgI/SA1388 family protein
MKLESLVQYMDEYLGVARQPDYPTALNGLQVGGPEEVSRIVAAVDASEQSIVAAVEGGADLLVVHHGLFWEGLTPLTGRLLRRVRPLLEAEVALYSCHLPLDVHPEVGNNALLARAVGVAAEGRFAAYQGVEIGWHGSLEAALGVEQLAARLGEAVGGPVRTLAGGPARIERVGVITGDGASSVREAAGLGLHALITGEARHHTYLDARELGIHVLLAGHYATETFGVKALAEHVADRFGLTWAFVDLPTGL